MLLIILQSGIITNHFNHVSIEKQTLIIIIIYYAWRQQNITSPLQTA